MESGLFWAAVVLIFSAGYSLSCAICSIRVRERKAEAEYWFKKYRQSEIEKDEMFETALSMGINLDDEIDSDD